VDAQSLESIVTEYATHHDIYVQVATAIEGLLQRLMQHHHIQIHLITSRAKDINSLARKLALNPGKYTRLTDITDLAGIRVTTYFDEDVDRVSQVIQSEFLIDYANSVDKRKSVEPDRFGYVSLHFVAQLGVQRSLLPEYTSVADRKFEIQIRSILQHAWAEMEHGLGYKSEIAIPYEIRRRFASLSATLGSADREFTEIRRLLTVYEAAVNQAVPDSLRNLLIDQVSLQAYIRDTAIVYDTDQLIAQKTKSQVFADMQYIGSLTRPLNYLNFSNIGVLDDHLRAWRATLVPFAAELLADGYPILYGGTSIWICCLAIVASRGSREEMVAYLVATGTLPRNAEGAADMIIATYRKVTGAAN
jgi:ppGpp synthetase/RelA/SpoT-type nucleotidyltranferase